MFIHVIYFKTVCYSDSSLDTSKLSATLSSRATAHCRISKDLLPDVFRGLDKHSRILARKSNQACQHTCPATRKGIEVNRCSTFVHEKNDAV